MLHTVRSFRGQVVAPHHQAAQAGLRVLEDGGNAIEAMVAAASTITVAYPHMNALGGDNFWLVHQPGQPVVAIDACGGAATMATPEFYGEHGHAAIPSRGPLAALTCAGAVSGWQAALELSSQAWGGKLPLDRLLEDARTLAADGVAVTRTLHTHTHQKLPELADVPGFAETYLTAGAAPEIGALLRQPRLAATLEQLGRTGLDDFYRGDLARSMAVDLEKLGSPLRLEDLERHHALRVDPLCLRLGGHEIYNMPPPTQGLASLLILGIFHRLRADKVDGFTYVHNLVEATKQAFRIRDNRITDPAYMDPPAAGFLTNASLDSLSAGVDRRRAAPWPLPADGGDTVWLGAIDNEGRAVSFIQSIYWEFGAGIVLDESGVTWQNRGCSFSLAEGHHNRLTPHRRPLHTIQPALARLNDGRVMPYGSMGGDGQPQTQAAIFSRHVLYRQPLQAAITAPRWLLGRTWGQETTKLRLESRFEADVISGLLRAGHDLEVIGPFDELMGHAGALVVHPDGLIEGATDPRSNGQVAAW